MDRLSKQEHDQRIAALQASKSDAEAAARVGLTTSGFRKWRQAAGIAPKSMTVNRAPLSSDEHQRRLDAWSISFDYADAARRIGITPAAMRLWATRAGLISPRNLRLGESESRDERYLRAYGEAFTDKEAAKLLKIPATTFAKWRRRMRLDPPSRQHKAWLKIRQERARQMRVENAEKQESGD